MDDLYFESGATRVVRGVFYGWFGEALEALMLEIRTLALDYALSMRHDLPGILGTHVTDWHIVDSSTVKLDRALINEYPGAGDYAALKVHKRFSVGLGTTVDYELSPARDHDNVHLATDETWKGLGVLLDLGYASFKLLRDCEEHDVRSVIRLKDSWKPKVQRVAVERSCGNSSLAPISTALSTTRSLSSTGTMVFSLFDGARFTGPDTILLEGIAVDQEDGQLPDDALRWTSDRDGYLGSGITLVDPTQLAEGFHEITASATDSDGLVGSTTVHIEIRRFATDLFEGPRLRLECTHEGLVGTMTTLLR